ncbi:hypothetical protein BU15DRAFT_63000 [Melanogaster broomeanus]|nr:hypothetical protein BU15DRAFT_63000 [Melanogaster broomeanus]
MEARGKTRGHIIRTVRPRNNENAVHAPTSEGVLRPSVMNKHAWSCLTSCCNATSISLYCQIMGLFVDEEAIARNATKDLIPEFQKLVNGLIFCALICTFIYAVRQFRKEEREVKFYKFYAQRMKVVGSGDVKLE